jgi:KipI family sensor histidine kinase inhibitor
VHLLPSGSHGLLVQLEDLDEVLALYAALLEAPLPGVVEVVPAASTILLVTEPGTSTEEVGRLVRGVRPAPGGRDEGDLVEVPVVYDGDDLDDVGQLLGCDRDEVVRRHTASTWTVAFCGFSPGFGYLTCDDGEWDVPRRSSPRTKVPPGSVALAGQFSGVYPRESPGGWQLLGRTDLAVFDLDREPAALLRPATRVRFVEVGR